MARIATVLTLIVIVAVCGGCASQGGGSNHIITPANYAPSTGEIDLVEQVTLHRQEYYQGLQMLASYYARIGNNHKLSMAEKELNAMNKMPRNPYISNIIPPEDLVARMVSPEADALYMDAEQLLGQTNLWRITFRVPTRISNKNTLLLAMDKYSQLIKNYPSSNKIGMAAFRIGYIQEVLKDSQTAFSYYQRAYQWDDNIGATFPARFMAAYLLDKRLNKRADAVDLYQQALTTEGLRWTQWREFAEGRVQSLTKTR